MNQPQIKKSLEGVTLEALLTLLVAHYGWDKMGERISIKCFTSDPSIKSSLKFLRKTPWARKKVEDLYLETELKTEVHPRIEPARPTNRGIMNIDHLKASLKSLHANLEKTPQVDTELQELLRALDSDIHQLLAKEPADAAPGETAAAESTTYGLAERAQEISAEFAVKHPQLEPALRELANILGNMGI